MKVTLKYLAVALALLFVVSTSTNAKIDNSYDDGHWWVLLPDPEKESFVMGYYDCYVFDRGARNYPDGSYKQIVSWLNEFYDLKSDNLSTPISNAFYRISVKMPGHIPKNTERHGFFDGEFWRQMSNQERSSFIRGYINCGRGSQAKNSDEIVDRYLKAISGYYGIDDDDASVINDEASTRKIGDIIKKVKINEIGIPHEK